jgi:hypothetical protein
VTHPFRKARELFEHDARWKAVPERDREELFHDAQRERDRREKEERRQERKRRCGAFRELLESAGIKGGAEWRKVRGARRWQGGGIDPWVTRGAPGTPAGRGCSKRGRLALL